MLVKVLTDVACLRGPITAYVLGSGKGFKSVILKHVAPPETAGKVWTLLVDGCATGIWW